MAPLCLGLLRGWDGLIEQFSHDSFYYLAVARKTSAIPWFSYDGLHTTNGFHPLWQLLLALLTRLPGLHEPAALVVAAFVCSALAVGLGMAMLGTALARAGCDQRVVLLGLVPGCFYLLFAVFGPGAVLSPWIHVDGMESGLSILLFGALALTLGPGGSVHSLPARRQWQAGFLLAAVVLTRLDDVFLAAALGLFLLLGRSTTRERMLTGVRLFAPVAVLLAIYLLQNRLIVGCWLPVSGAAKYGYSLDANLDQLRRVLGIIAEPTGSARESWWGFRAINLWAPVLAITGFALASIRVRGRGAWWSGSAGLPVWLKLAVPYVLLKGGYNILFVGPFNQGQWYFPLSGLLVNCLVCWLVCRAWARMRSAEATPPKTLGVRFVAIAAVLLCLGAVAFARAKSGFEISVNGKQRLTSAWAAREEIRSFVHRAYPGEYILEMDDGIVGFLLDNPTMNATGFMLDYEGHRARLQGRLLDLAWQRGVGLLGSVQYIRVSNRASADECQAWARQEMGLSMEQTERWRFSFEWQHPSGFTLLRFAPAPGLVPRGRPHAAEPR